MIDRLEPRRFLDAFVEPDGTLVVVGTGADDTIQLTPSVDFRFIDVTIAGGETVNTSFLSKFGDPVFGVQAIRVIGDLGNDSIVVFPQFGVNVEVYGDLEGGGGVGEDNITAGGGYIPGDTNPLPLFSTIFGGDGNDVINAVGGSFDSIEGGDGNDQILGGVGDDTLEGGNGNDQITADDGNDILFGGAGVDQLSGGEGNDTMQGGAGTDTMTGGGGIDIADYTDRNARIWVTWDGAINEGLFNVVQNVNTSTENDAMGDDWEGVICGGGNDIIDGTSASVSLFIIGGGGQDSLTGSDIGDDTLDGGVGNDTIRGLGGADSILGGANNDNIFGDAGGDILFGDWNVAENPEIGASGSPLFGNDTLNGGDDNDTMDGEEGNDRYLGGAGDDFFTAGVDAVITAFQATYSGSDIYDGQAGIDTVDYSLRTKAILANFDGGADDGDPDPQLNLGFGEQDQILGATECVIGTALNDTMTATSGTLFSHWFIGGNGNDSLVTADGADTIDGGAGNDTISAGKGGDLVDGGTGIDIFSYTNPLTQVARTADITITFNDQPDDGEPGEGDDLRRLEIITTGSGNDSVDGSLAPSAVSINSSSGNDTIRGSAFDDTLNAGTGDNSLFGNGGNDTMIAGPGADDYSGGAGFDFVDYSNATALVSVSFDDVANDGTTNEGDNVRTDVEGFQGGDTGNVIDISNSPAGRRIVGGSGNDTIIGSAFNDTLEGGAGADLIRGGDGNDYLIGGGGDDTLQGENGNDRLLGSVGRDNLDGGAGNDTLIGAGGSDVLIGGAGRDMASHYYETRGVVYSLDAKPNDGVPGENDDIRNDVENFQGGRGNDTMTGNSGRNAMDGGPGNDLLIGMNGMDTLYGNTGSDTLNGGSHDDWLIGAAGPDRLIGGNGVDTGDYSAYTVAVFLSLDNLANDGAFNEFDKIDRDVESLLGGSGADSIVGGVLAETLNGGPGNDTIRGGALNDCLIGGAGFDQLFGDDGDDTLVANDGQRDTLVAGTGNDSLLQDLGLDILQ